MSIGALGVDIRFAYVTQGFVFCGYVDNTPFIVRVACVNDENVRDILKIIRPLSKEINPTNIACPISDVYNFVNKHLCGANVDRAVTLLNYLAYQIYARDLPCDSGPRLFVDRPHAQPRIVGVILKTMPFDNLFTNTCCLMLTISEIGTEEAIRRAAAIVPSFKTGMVYLVDIDSDGIRITESLKNSTSATVICHVESPEHPLLVSENGVCPVVTERDIQTVLLYLPAETKPVFH